MKRYLRRYRGPKNFYVQASKIAVPLAMQQLLGSCMGIVDSLMVSWIGEVTTVGTAAQIDVLCSDVAYGAIGGTGIFAAQFYGAQDDRNLKRTFGLSLVLAFINGLFWMLLALFFGSSILHFYMPDARIVDSGLIYLQIAMLSYLPSSLTFAFSYVYRSIHKTLIPLIISVFAMLANCIMNYLFIFGIGPFPELGIQGAALGTLIAQSLALLIHIFYAYSTHQPFIGTWTEMFSFDPMFLKQILHRISPLIINELMFGFGTTLFIKAFGSLGSHSMEAYYVGQKISDVFFFVVMGISNATAAIIGNTLGSGDVQKAKEQGDYFVGMACMLAVLSIIIIHLFAYPMVAVFALQDDAVIALAVIIVQVFSIKISLRLFIVIIFSTLRAGGDSKMLSFLDSGIMWLVGLPLAFFLVHVMQMTNIALVFLIIQIEQIVRIFIGMRRYRSGSWTVNLTNTVDA